MRLEGKTALVTGAGSGIGRAVAERFAAEGARVVVADINESGARITAETLGSHAKPLKMDVSERASVEAGVSAAAAWLGGHLDIVVNAAGITIVGAVHELTEDEWDRELDTNLKSIYLISKAVWPTMTDQGGGSIISVASGAAFLGIPNDAAYCASKAGVVMLTKCLALDGARANIRANCVCPGYIDTPMLQGFFEAQPDPASALTRAVGAIPMGRLGRATDVAAGVLYLASDDAEWVSGIALPIDGASLSGYWSDFAEGRSQTA